ncbi:MAG: hypothetical protein IJD04_08415, partial [Desulfovibrionaceae bacterium]|nr:hypothetical protein [Desulfovibrionaceae bacterium]
MLYSSGMRFYVLAICFILSVLTGCSAKQEPLLLADPLAAGRQTEQAAEALLASDAEGQIPAPELPPALVQAAEAYTEFQDAHVSKAPLHYRVVCHSPDAPD